MLVVDAMPPCPSCGHELRANHGVIVLDDLPGAGDYPEGLYELDRVLEEGHWWYASRNQVIAQELSPWIRRLQLRTLLDVGCGTGFVLRHFQQMGLDVIGLDMSLAGLAIARERVSAPLIRSGAQTLPLADPLDVVALMDVLEHADEAPLLRACHDALRPGGVLLVSVPARPSLWSLEDTVVGHRRRYTKPTLRAALSDAGLQLLRLRPFHSAVTLVALAGRRGRPVERQPPADPAAWLAERRVLPSASMNRVMTGACAVESLLSRWIPLP
ncbi:MAG: SAM-dependent methyltransferase, partial [Pseudohongiellaceae bacterium]